MNSVSQSIGEVLFSHPDYIDKCIETVVKSRKELYNEILKIESDKIEKIYETHTNFVFMKVKNAKKIFEKMKDNSIIIRNMGDYLRITAGTEYENAKMLETFRKVLEEV